MPISANNSTNQKGFGADFSTSMKKHALNMPKFELEESVHVSEP